MTNLREEAPGHFGNWVARRVCWVFPEKNLENGGLLATSTHPMDAWPPGATLPRHPATKNGALAGRFLPLFPEEKTQNTPLPATLLRGLDPLVDRDNPGQLRTRIRNPRSRFEWVANHDAVRRGFRAIRALECKISSRQPSCS